MNTYYRDKIESNIKIWKRYRMYLLTLAICGLAYSMLGKAYFVSGNEYLDVILIITICVLSYLFNNWSGTVPYSDYTGALREIEEKK